MSLRVFIIHRSTVIKNILQKYIRADHSNAVIESGESQEHISMMLEDRKYDIIFSGLEMADMDGLDILDHICASEVNQETPLIIMTASDSREQRERLVSYGVLYILPIPFTSTEFRSIMDKVFERPFPKAAEISETPSWIPKTRAFLWGADQHISADVIHISRDTVISEIEGSAEPDLSEASRLTIQFPADYGKAIGINITGRLLGLKEKSYIRDAAAPRIRLAWKILWESFELSTATSKPLKFFLGDKPFPDSL